MKEARETGLLDLTDFEKGSKEAWRAFVASLRELENALEGKKAITDKTKLAAMTMNGFAKLKGAEVHRMAMEIMARRKVIIAGASIPEITDGK